MTRDRRKKYGHSIGRYPRHEEAPTPAGEKKWLVLRTGMDFRLRCTGCGHEVMLPRSKAEKNIREVLRDSRRKSLTDAARS